MNHCFFLTYQGLDPKLSSNERYKNLETRNAVERLVWQVLLLIVKKIYKGYHSKSLTAVSVISTLLISLGIFGKNLNILGTFLLWFVLCVLCINCLHNHWHARPNMYVLVSHAGFVPWRLTVLVGCDEGWPNMVPGIKCKDV